MKPNRSVLYLLVATILVVPACLEQAPPVSQPSMEDHSKTTPAPLGHRGVLEGQVLFEGPEILESTLVENTTDPEDCGTVQSLQNILISKKNRGIKNVIVALKGVPLPEGYQPQASRLIIDNRDCQFQPRVSVLTTGSTIETSNSDPILHTVHLYGTFNLNIAVSPNHSRTLAAAERPGLFAVKCDLHGWMQGYFRVDDHPFHSVSTADGRFRIDMIPAGSYLLEVWHEYFGRTQVSVNIEPDTPSHVTIYYGAQSP